MPPYTTDVPAGTLTYADAVQADAMLAKDFPGFATELGRTDEGELYLTVWCPWARMAGAAFMISGAGGKLVLQDGLNEWPGTQQQDAAHRDVAAVGRALRALLAGQTDVAA